MARFKPAPQAIFAATIGTDAAALTTTTGIIANAGIDVIALSANTVPVYLGTSTAVTTSDGWPLAPGARKRFMSTDPSKLYGIAGSASQGVRVSAER